MDVFLNTKPVALKKSVSFGSIEIREYPVVLGDNHSVKFPLALDWDHQNSLSVDCEEYEESRACLRRTSIEMFTPPCDRLGILLKHNSRDQVTRSAKALEQVAKQAKKELDSASSTTSSQIQSKKNQTSGKRDKVKPSKLARLFRGASTKRRM
eukprot:CAMPEP_0118705090 /NCGR_PEP_ID=MMETSP0800-20121206/19653_1 /TAXON_ID=210618 ORGANISM="Striatella unipunctata, Strain CCMP2910" /NCGR_SAMPLE_ID=MMETSP0800 /ASSEMBLY_ACC=CAM_ASM_000638 /LENGTH=152 /DNA_ID=CAMNT_0006607163 /DNA_START=81 /DNA_END=539 /DNA_ORIENTATION=+